MGYETDYNGLITLSKNGVKKLNKFVQEKGELEEHFNLEGIDFNNNKISIGGYGKVYENEIEKFCFAIAMLDKKSCGEIKCNGEESFDIWKVIIKNGKAEIQGGRVIYEKDYDFEDIKIKKEVYKITKDKKLMKEIIVGELE